MIFFQLGCEEVRTPPRSPASLDPLLEFRVGLL